MKNGGLRFLAAVYTWRAGTADGLTLAMAVFLHALFVEWFSRLPAVQQLGHDLAEGENRFLAVPIRYAGRKRREGRQWRSPGL
jgi:hypothetical protein